MTGTGEIFYANIEEKTLQNNFYRNVLYTTDRQQVVLMSVKPKEDIKFEIHPENDQFIRIEKGRGQLYIGQNKESTYDLFDGISVLIPAGNWHQIVNTSDTDDLKLYTIYSPPNHPRGKIDITRPPDNQDGGGFVRKNDKRSSFANYRDRNYIY